MSEWISVEDRLPEMEKDVLVINEKGGFKKSVITAGLFSGYGVMPINGYDDVGWASWETEDCVKGNITHWQNLPEPPK